MTYGNYTNGSDVDMRSGLPPQNLEAEQGVLAAILITNAAADDVLPVLEPEDFYRDAHQLMYRAIRDLINAGKAVDAITLFDELERRGEAKATGGHEYIAEVRGSVPHAANAMYHATIVRQKSIARRLIDDAQLTIKEGYSNSFTAEALLESASRRVFAIAESGSVDETVSADEAAQVAMDLITSRRSGISGTTSGIVALDEATDGFQRSSLIVLAARPSMGKSALALNFAAAAMSRPTDGVAPTPVLVFSLEMNRYEIMHRLLVMASKIESHQLLDPAGKLSTPECSRLSQAYAAVRRLPLWVNDSANMKASKVAAIARSYRRKHRIGMIIVDYLQLLSPEDPRDSRQEQVAKMSRQLKIMARELSVPVIVLSQLNRDIENRPKGERKPRMADLRESGAIEQDADVVLLMHRPDYYDPSDRPGICELHLAKNRNGATKTIDTMFIKSKYLFDEHLTVIGPPIDDGPAF